MAEEKKGSWRDIFRTFKYAISPQKILVALIGLIVFNLLNYIFFSGSFILVNAGRHLANAVSMVFGFGAYGSTNFPGVNLIGAARELGEIFWSFIPIKWGQAALGDVVWVAIFYLFAWFVFAAVVGVVTRISAVQIARDENIGIREGIKFAWRKYLSYFAPPVLVVVAFLVVGVLLNYILSIPSAIPGVGPTLFALLLFPIMIIFGLAAVVVILFGTLGSPLMGPAIAVEGQDTFDALSRAYHYSIQRLGRYVFYLVVLLLFMCVATWFVNSFIINGIETVTAKAATMVDFGGDTTGRYERMAAAYRGTWPIRAEYEIYRDGEDVEIPSEDQMRPGDVPITDKGKKPFHVLRGGKIMLVAANDKKADDTVIKKIELKPGEDVGGFILGIWLKGLHYIVGAFAISFFFTGCTMIYFVLRKQIDGAEMDEVYMEGEDEEFEFGDESEESEKAKESD